MIRRVHPHAGEGCGLCPASDEGTGPKRSEETGDEERQRLDRTTRTNAASRINRRTSEESTVGAKRRNRGRRATECRWNHCDHVHLVTDEPATKFLVGAKRRNQEQGAISCEQKRTRRGSPRRRGPVASAVGSPAGKNLHQVDNLIRKGMQ